MAENKTQENEASVDAFIEALPDEQRRQDCYTLIDLMQRLTGEPPKMWGDGIVGFGKQPYKYASGREGEWFRTGFAPRKGNITLYLTYGFDDNQDLLQRLGKHKTGKACLYVKRLSEVDQSALEELITTSIQ